MNIDTTTSLIITTYNNPDFLYLSVLSAFRQTILPSEIIIADDGSTDNTYKMIQVLKKQSPIPLIHIWQQDEGFRAGQIRNIAIAAAQYEYIIQIDGDIIMDKYFVADHLVHRELNTILQGSRVFISKEATKRITLQKDYQLSFFSWGISRRENAIRSKIVSTYLSTRYRNRYPVYFARGCNMSYYREDALKVNGYNDAFSGWGHEDSEFTLRLLNNGCIKKFIKFHCVAYHLYHKEKSRQLEPVNKNLMDEQVRSNARWCDLGIDRFLPVYNEFIRE